MVFMNKTDVKVMEIQLKLQKSVQSFTFSIAVQWAGPMFDTPVLESHLYNSNGTSEYLLYPFMFSALKFVFLSFPCSLSKVPV